MSKKRVNKKYLSQLFETDTTYAEWFGYYNYDTLNATQDKMLCNRAEFEGCALDKEKKIELGWYDISTGEWHSIGITDSFNWQQGAMLQWMPGNGNENKVIYNFSDGQKFKACIYDTGDGTKRILDWPIYGITPDGRRSITLNYERSFWCRAYHYQPIQNPKYDVQVDEDDGIFEVDIVSNTVRRIVDVADVIRCDYLDVFDGAKHWLEHIMINPDGSRFVFLHRFSVNDAAYRTRLCIADIDGANLQIIPGWQQNDWSHFGWHGNDAFAIYTVESSLKAVKYAEKVIMETKAVKKSPKVFLRNIIKSCIPKRIRRKIIGKKNYYQYYTLKQGKFVFTDKFDGKWLDIDGHPSFTSDGRYMVTDSYPDAKKFQRLLVMDIKTKKTLLLGKFFAPYMGNPASCDLHPKLCLDNKYLVVDTAYSGLHHMICFELNWDEIKKKLSKKAF